MPNASKTSRRRGTIQSVDRAARILKAVEAVLTDGKVRPTDLGGTAGTAEFTDAVCRAIA